MMEKEKLVSLVRAVQQQKDGAAGELYDVFYDDIYYHILSTVNKDPELAADLTQDTFIEILETIHKLQEPAAFVTWSKQIAYHKCTAYFRKRREILLDETEDGYSVMDTIEEDRAEFIPGDGLDQEAFKQAIHEMIRELPMEQRAALTLRYFNEHSVKEIAQIQGVSEGTVKSRLNYARKALKQAVEAYEKKHDIRLHSVGVLPILLWFFRAYRRASGTAITVGSAVAVFDAAAATGTAGVTAAAVTTTAKEGVKAGVSAFFKATATKVVAGVAAASVAVAGVAMAVANPKPKPEVWSGTVTEYREGEITTPNSWQLIMEESDQLYAELEILETEETAYTGTLQLTWETDVVYRSDFRMTLRSEKDDLIRYSLETEPIFVEGLPENDSGSDGERLAYIDELNITYDKSTDTLTLGEGNMYAWFKGTLTKESSQDTVLLSAPITKEQRKYRYSEEVLYYEKLMDGTYGWVDMEESERLQDYYAPPQETEEYGIGYEYLAFAKLPDENKVAVAMGISPVFHEPMVHVVIPEEVDGIPVTILGSLGSYDMETVVLPETITELDSPCFVHCVKLKSVTLPGGITELGASTFEACYSLEEIVVPEGVEIVERYAFTSCVGLKKISFPATMTELGSFAVAGSPRIESIEVASGNPVYHSSGNCVIETETKILVLGCKTSEIPADGSVTTIGRFAFAMNTELNQITIPEGVTQIEYAAFAQCTNLSSISLPKSVETIDHLAFKFCSNLTDVYYAGTMKEFENIQGIRWDAEYHDFCITVHCVDGEMTIG